MSNNVVNFGGQSLVYDFRQEARAKGFNEAFCDTLPYGIYTGGRLTRVSDTVINVGVLVCVIKSDESDKVALRVETSENQDISLAASFGSSAIDISRPFIVLRFGWQDVEINYMNMLAVGWSTNPLETDPTKLNPFDIILGKVIFQESPPGSGNCIIAPVNSFDLSRRQDVFIKEIESVAGQFRVSSSEVDPKKVFISGGKVNTSRGQFIVPGAEFPAEGIPDTDSRGRVDLIAIDAHGQFKFIQGTPSVIPVTPKYLTYKVLAEIHRGPNRSNVLGTDIVQITDSTIRGQILAEDFALEDREGLLPGNTQNVEDAIHYLVQRSITLEDALEALSSVVVLMDANLSKHIIATVDDGNIVHGIHVVTDQNYPLDID